VKFARWTGPAAIASGWLVLALAPAAQAAGPYELLLDQGSAFAILGHSCGGIQEESLATGFAPSGYPQGDVHLSTRCGGSGRGGGYKTTTYSAWAAVEWTWFGETRSDARLEGAGGPPGFEATDAHGDRVYDAGAHAYLETGEPPLQPPAAPTGVAASVYLTEAGEGNEYLSLSATWSLDPITSRLITSSTVTARPVNPGPPVLSATTSGDWADATLAPVQPSTAYLVTVTSTDAEGTSAPSEPVEVTSPNGDGEAEHEGGRTTEVCETAAGTLKLSPGLSETPHVQDVTLKGTLSGCDGPVAIESAAFTDHLVTNEEVTCAVLASLASEPTTSSTSLSVKWAPREAGTSHGSLAVPITEAGGATVTGQLEGGPFGAPAPVSGSLLETFTGGSSCGAVEGRSKAKPVRAGTFAGTNLQIG
jgi:hypothetical protein